MSTRKRIGHGLLAAVLTLALVFSLPFAMPVPMTSYASGNFPDTTGHWAEKFISRAYNLNIVDGYANGKFLPDKAVTRAEFISMVNNAIGLNISASSDFSDVLPGQWYYDDISEAVTSSYAGGYSDNTFRPNTPITRQEAAVMLAKILPNYKEKGNLKSYRDSRQINTWATAAIEKLAGQAYMGPYGDGKFHPNDPLTRAQTAKILCDILDNETIVKDDTVVDTNNTTLTGKIYVCDVTIDEALGEGNATIDNCVILGNLYVEGGGSKSVTVNNSRVAKMLVEKDDSPVRVVTKGTTVIPKVSASEASILQTSSKDGSGMQEVTVDGDADVTLKGNFPVVKVAGNTASVTLESGKITTLTVDRAGRYSDITLSGKAEVTEATVNAESYFHGTGTIVHMNVNADDVTYETKPKKMTVGVSIDRALGEADTDSDLEVEINPDNKDLDVDLDVKITLTFNTSIKLATNVPITTANIKNFATLRTTSKGGVEVECAGTINAAKKVVSLTPKAELNPDTRYYVVLADETVMNANGSKNNEEYIYFTTGTESSNSLATYHPEDGETGVTSGTAITIRFSKDVVMSDGGEVTASYLQQCVVFKAGNSTSGSAVAFTASISSRDKITITPSAGLTAGQTYYLAVVRNKLKTKDGGKPITGSSATWSTASATPVTTAATLNSLTLAPSGGSNLLTGFSASTYTYSVTVPFETTSVDVAATAASGTSITVNGTVTPPALNLPVTGSALTPISVVAASSGMTSTTYTVNVQVAGNTSLSAITIDGTPLLADADVFSDTILLGETTAFIAVNTVDPNAAITIGTLTGTGTCNGFVTLGPGNQVVTITVRSNMTTKTYTIHFTRLAY